MQKVILYTDGGSRGNPGPAGAGAVVTDEGGGVIKEASKSLGTMTNNEAEYHALILGLETLKKQYGKEKIGEMAVEARLDSELVVSQLRGEYQMKDEKLVPLFMKIWNARIAIFPHLTFTHIPREKNARADQLANEAMDNASGGSSTPLWSDSL